MSTNVPPMPAPGGAPPRKRTSPLVWMLVGIGGFVFLIFLLVVAAGVFVVHKAKQAGFDAALMKSNPAVAMAKLMAAANPDAEVVSIDEKRGIITVREKKTGKTVTMNFEDAKKGKISFEGEGGEKVSIESQGEGNSGSVQVKSSEGATTVGSGGAARLPAWFPAYPGVAPEGAYSVEEKTGAAGTLQFTTKDAPEQVIQFYEAGLKGAGLKVFTFKQDRGGIVTGQDDSGQRSAQVTVSPGAGNTQVTLTFQAKK